MTEERKVFNERSAASLTLLAVTRRVSESLPTFSGWLMGGFGAGFSLVLANLETVSKFVGLAHIRFGLLVFLAGLVFAVLGNYLSMIVRAAVDSQGDGEVIANAISKSEIKFDVALYAAEFERGLFPPHRWIARRSMRKAMSGDTLAAVRMIAKLSQAHAMCVVLQGLLAIAAALALAIGLKVQ
jgi:hypothetical protein